MSFLCCCASQTESETARPAQAVVLDVFHMGADAVIVKAGRRLCGSGAAMANAPLVQTKSYWEVTLQAQGVWGIGICTRAIDLNSVPLGKLPGSWVLRSSGSLHNLDSLVGSINHDFVEGDVIVMQLLLACCSQTQGCTYDHDVLVFYINGVAQAAVFRSIRGEVYPVLYVDKGAILEVEFVQFKHKVDGFQPIMLEKSIL